MKPNVLRLRLVIRRNALPDVRIVFGLPLENNPTIANLVEKVNESFPLESNDWGLEDYVVEMHDPEGSPFEYTHYQPVSDVLRNDEEI